MKPTSEVYETAMELQTGSQLIAIMEDRTGSGHILVQVEKFGVSFLGSLKGSEGCMGMRECPGFRTE